MKRIVCLAVVLSASLIIRGNQEFTVLAYNVENFFDLDGVALYPEYNPAPAGDYGPRQVLGKLRSIHRTLAEFNDGAGPEVIMFQEFELDRTAFDTPTVAEFLRMSAQHSLEEILLENIAIGTSVRNLPAELLLLKYLEDHGMKGYHIAQPDPFRSETHPPHKNVVFSRFPVNFIRQRPTLNARDVLVVGLDVNGHELVVINNHWKSGASSPSLEPVRIQNALVTRAEVEAVLNSNPDADIIVAGDLNAYYNHSAAFPQLQETSVNDVLKSSGREIRMLEEGTDTLYNLWFELDPEKRGSEVYRGKWGTLMQMLLSPGLYDSNGISYIDNSFNRLVIPNENVEGRWGRPISWTNFGGGSGFSDHLPIYARFRVMSPGSTVEFRNLSDEAVSEYRPVIDLSRLDRRAVPSVEILAGLDDAGLAAHLGKLFKMKLPTVAVQPVYIKLAQRKLMIYTPIQEVRKKLDALSVGDEVEAYVELDTFRGKPQLVISHPSWFIR